MHLLSRNLRYEKRHITLSKRGLTAIVADTQRKMTVGLMFRESMKHDECMLFVFPGDGPHPIWMRNMRFPIDILWLDSKCHVVDMVESVKPTSGLDFSGYRSKEPSRYVLELNAGFVKRNRIKINSVAKLGV